MTVEKESQGESADEERILARARKLIQESRSENDQDRIFAASVFSQDCVRDVPGRDEVWQRMTEMVSDPSGEVRIKIAEGFRAIGSKGWGKVWPQRDPSVLTEEDLKTAQFAAENLLRLTKDSEPKVQQEALRGLGVMGVLGIKREKIESRCLEILDESQKGEVFNEAIDQLAIMRSEDPRVRQNLLQRLQGEDERDRTRSAKGLREVGQAEDIPLLQSRLDSAGPIERTNIEWTIGAIEKRSEGEPSSENSS